MRSKLNQSQFDTPLGKMLAIADDKTLYLLEFTDRKNVQKEIDRLQSKGQSSIVERETAPISLIKQELAKYFAGKLSTFTTPIAPIGSPFQLLVWETLRKIPFGQTLSYAGLAAAI
ncbi:MAG TPA: bifunctional transcriptional activator/DNA repair enzyme protein Ada, partial [Parachlamydiales bacterium]|nr:bifunctional transcriptional activator/DNA repair enzyme protein Ada [Parachlamydiales bacterium]